MLEVEFLLGPHATIDIQPYFNEPLSHDLQIPIEVIRHKWRGALSFGHAFVGVLIQEKPEDPE